MRCREGEDWATAVFSTPRNFIEMATDLITETELANFRHDQIESNRRTLIQRITNRKTIDRLKDDYPRSGFATQFRDYLVLGKCNKTTFFAMPLVIHQRIELVSSPPIKEFSLEASGYQTVLLTEPVIVTHPNYLEEQEIPNNGPAYTVRPNLIKSLPDREPLVKAIYEALKDNYEKARESILKLFQENTKLDQKQDWIAQGIKDYKQVHFIKDSL